MTRYDDVIRPYQDSPVTDPIAYRQALDALPHLVWVAAPDGALEYMNRRCAEYTGVPIDDLLGWDWGWVMHPSDLPGTLAVWNASIRAGTPHEVEFRIRRSDGEYRWFLARAEPVRDSAGHVTRWFGTCTDIDESRRAVDHLRSMRVLFRALVERSEDGFALVGADGTVRYANPVAARLLGFQVDDLTGTDLWCSVAPDDRRPVAIWWERILASPGQRLTTTVHFLMWGGTSRPLCVFGTNLLPDPDVRAVAVQLREVESE
jgi:PAS domain S-box-containing protein